MKMEHEYLKAALAGDKEALEQLLASVQDQIFTLALRMLGTVADAQDASQDILIRIITNLSTFKEEAKFSTWTYRIAINYLLDYRRSMFAQHPLSFEDYANDLQFAQLDLHQEEYDEQERKELAQELKISCSNVMLQCLDPQTRCIFILGTMFHVDSVTAASLLDMTPQNYRQRLSRARKKMATFLSASCAYGGSNRCSCERRIGYAISQHRLHPQHMEYKGLKVLDETLLHTVTNSMEEIEDKMPLFEELPHYHASDSIRKFVEELLNSTAVHTVENA